MGIDYDYPKLRDLSEREPQRFTIKIPDKALTALGLEPNENYRVEKVEPESLMLTPKSELEADDIRVIKLNKEWVAGMDIQPRDTLVFQTTPDFPPYYH